MSRLIPDVNSPSGLSRVLANGSIKYCTTSNGKYWRVWVEGRHVVTHRILWELINGEIPEGYEIDHKDRNGLNNELSNLRLVRKSEQNANRGNWGAYGRFITKTKSGFCVQIQYRVKLRHYVKTLEEATALRDKLVEEHSL